ncbi:AraC family transcriptional regulator [Cellulophaga sp. F20128]|uniref:AraC family transcriptional regulator n=1 Tax=Cellulophaga sp. F20128 TaxID=2926413 RepID=UPI001FF130F9|nr:helix-turn-helix transcriptional regulator [Cellulophaga sp. F20128]MCK0156771.1 AraC family transcriptional regulator [Cellulophaga sp. F20128]
MINTISTYNKITSQIDVKIEVFDIRKRYTKPHRHNKYLEIVYFVQGTGFHHIDFKSFEIKPPVVFLIKKDEVHNWEIDIVPKGFVIIIKESFLEKTLDKFINSQLMKLQNVQKINIAPKDKSLGNLFKALCWEIKQESINKEVVEGGIKAILAKLVNYASVSSIETTDNATLFLELLSKKLKNNVAFYANELHTTSQNLNALCNRVFNKTASDVIAEHIIKEVKRQLLYTSRPISDIAYDLDFKDTSHFSKYFKRFVKQTPLQYKKSQG